MGTPYYAHTGGCNLADADWTDSPFGGGTPLASIAALQNGDTLDNNGQSSIEINENIGAADKQITLACGSSNSFTCGQDQNLDFYIDIASVTAGMGSNNISFGASSAGYTQTIHNGTITGGWMGFLFNVIGKAGGAALVFDNCDLLAGTVATAQALEVSANAGEIIFQNGCSITSRNGNWAVHIGSSHSGNILIDNCTFPTAGVATIKMAGTGQIKIQNLTLPTSGYAVIETFGANGIDIGEGVIFSGNYQGWPFIGKFGIITQGALDYLYLPSDDSGSKVKLYNQRPIRQVGFNGGMQ